MNRNAPSQRRRYPSQYLDGAELKRRRTEAGHTQAALAEAAGTTQNQLTHLESGDWGCGIEMICALATALKCSPADLMHDDGIARYKALTEALGSLAAA